MRPHSVLLVDDDVDTRTIVRRLLEHHGYAILEASDHDAALATAREQEVGLVVTELYVPRGGERACMPESLKADRDTAEIPVVVLTTQAFDADEQRAREAGSARYFVKPFAARELVSAVIGLLS
jgi:DNA-binding response OmpR family regulator